MASYDKQFTVIQPDWGQLSRMSVVVADPTLLNPTNAAAFIDGEFMQLDNTRKLIRSTDNAKMSFPLMDDRGDTGVQGHKKPTILMGPRGYRASTVVYADALAAAAFGAKLEVGTINLARLGSTNRRGLVAFGSGLTVGIIIKSPATAGGPLEYLDLVV